MKKLIKIFIRYIGYTLFLPLWWLQKLIIRNKKIWVFGAWYGQKYSDNSKYLFEYVLNNNSDIKPIWITKNKKILELLKSKKYPVYMSNSIKGIFFTLQAKYCILSSGVVDINKFFINGCKQIWLWHGMPLKKILCCEESYKKRSRIRILLSNIFSFNKFNPFSTITSSDFFTPFLAESFLLPNNRIWKTGLPRCDVFFTSEKDTFLTELKKKYSNPKVILYMPTFRMSSKMNGSVFSPFKEEYGFIEQEFIDYIQKENILFLFKPHFVDQSVKIKINSDRFIFLNDSMFSDLYLLLNTIDELITDYSSVFFDFIPTKKTIYLFPFDYEEYIRNSRAHFFNMYKEMSGIICSNWKDFYLKSNNAINKNIDCTLNEKFIEYINGKSSKKITEMIITQDY